MAGQVEDFVELSIVGFDARVVSLVSANAFTKVQAQFIQPPGSGIVVAQVEDTEWIVSGQPVFVGGGGGFYKALTVIDTTHVELQNLATSLNASAGTPIPAGAGVAPGGSPSADGIDKVSQWNLYTPTFNVPSSAGATIGNGSIAGRWRRVGADTVEIEVLLIWGSTSSWGAAAVPTFLVDAPPGVTYTVSSAVLAQVAGTAIVQASLAGILNGTNSAGFDYFATVFTYLGNLVTGIGIPAATKALFVNGDVVHVRVSVPCDPPSGA